MAESASRVTANNVDADEVAIMLNGYDIDTQAASPLRSPPRQIHPQRTPISRDAELHQSKDTATASSHTRPLENLVRCFQKLNPVRRRRLAAARLAASEQVAAAQHPAVERKTVVAEEHTTYDKASADIIVATHNRLATALEIQNSYSSILRKLPPELILDICDFLGLVDRLCLQRSCRRYASLLRNRDRKTRLSLTPDEKKDVTYRLSRDIEQRLQRTSPEHFFLLPYLCCSSCNAHHKRRSFPSLEIDKSASTRRCIGTLGHVKICAHASFTYHSIRALVLRHGTHFRCRHPDHQGLLWNAPFVTRIKSGGDGDYVACVRTLIHETVQVDEPVMWVMLAQKFNDMAEYLCPHLRTDHPRFQDMVFSHRKVIGAGGRDVEPERERDGAPLVFSKPFEWTVVRVRCEVEKCDTVVTLDRSVAVAGLQCTVHRRFGPLVDPMDERWCAQLER